MERERHRQHSPLSQQEPESPQLQQLPDTPAKSQSLSGQEVNGGSSVEGGTAERESPHYESPEPENGSDFGPVENEQTEADQATAAEQSKDHCVDFPSRSYEKMSFRMSLTAVRTRFRQVM